MFLLGALLIAIDHRGVAQQLQVQGVADGLGAVGLQHIAAQMQHHAVTVYQGVLGALLLEELRVQRQ